MTGPIDPDATHPIEGQPDATLPADTPASSGAADRTYVGSPAGGGSGGGGSDGLWDDEEDDRRRLWWLAAGALAAGVIVGVIVALVVTGGDDKKEAATTTTSTSTTTSSTTTTTLPPTTTTTGATIPSQVLNLTASPGGGSGEVSLQWDAASGATSYRIYRADTMGTSGALIATVNTNEYVDTPGVHKYYTVTAVNSAGEGPKSVETCGAVAGDPC